jgi:type IX secretion system substrate protein
MNIRNIVILLILHVYSISLFGQSCQPDTSFTVPGIYPDSATGIAEATENQPYDQTVTVVVPADTMVVIIAGPPQPVFVDSVIIDEIIGAPAWLTVECTPLDCKFIGGSSACVKFSGTPSPGEGGNDYPLSFVTRTHGRLKSFPGIPLPAQIDTVLDYYTLKVNFPIGINQADYSDSWQLSPNPASDILNIRTKTGLSNDISWIIIDMTGKQVKSGVFLKNGEQWISVRDLNPGVYFIQISEGDKTGYQKFVKF